MAEAVISALAKTAIGEILNKVIECYHGYNNYDKNYDTLYEFLSRLQPLVSDLLSQNADNPAVSNWLQSLQNELNMADELLTNLNALPPAVMKKPSNSKKIMQIMEKIQKILGEWGVVNMSSTPANLLKFLENESKGAEQCSILARVTRDAFQTHYFDKSLGTTTASAAVSEIRRNANPSLYRTIAEISDTITTRPAAATVSDLPRLRHQDAETIFGGNETVENLCTLLLAESERWIGIWSTGGAGKTLTAQRVHNSKSVQEHFSGGVFWLTVGRDSSKKKLLRDLLTELAVLIECPLSPAEFELNEADLKNCLCGKLANCQKVLLFLDDVWQGQALDWLDVLPRSVEYGNKMFVTTRNVEVLEAKHAAKFPIPMLNTKQSRMLFCFHAFPGGADNVPAELQLVVEEVADECKGLPLALKVVGSALTGKREARQWQHALNKLKSAETLSPDHETQLFARLELSLDELPRLHPRLRDCFLYFAAFPEDFEVSMVSDLLDLWIGDGIIGTSTPSSQKTSEDEAYELLGWLIARSLIELHSSPKNKYMASPEFMTCKVHDVLRDLARHTLHRNKAPQDRECLYEARRLLNEFPREWIASLTMHTASTKLSARRLSLAFNNLKELPRNLNAPYLQVLLLRDNEPLVYLPKSLIASLRNLRVLDIRNTSISHLPRTIGNLKLLAVLNLSECSLLKKLPHSIGKLKNLRCLDISRCKGLAWLPSKMFQLTNLQKLNLVAIASAWESKKQTFISSLPYSQRAKLKDICSLSGLIQLRISGESMKFPIYGSSLNKLIDFKAQFRNLVELPDVGDLKSLRSLDLTGCFKLRTLPNSLVQLTNLISLNLTNCQPLTNLPALDSLPRLEILNLSGCVNVELPSSFARDGGFPNLIELSLVGYQKANMFLSLEPGAMPNLTRLVLTGWDQLKSMPQNFQHLKKLRRLELDSCQHLQSLDDSLDLYSLSSLEELNVSNCRSLSALPPSLASLPNFKVLKVINYKGSIPSELLEQEKNGKLQLIREVTSKDSHYT